MTVAHALLRSNAVVQPSAKRFIHVTHVELEDGSVQVLARCDLCEVLAECYLKEGGSFVNVLGAELLAARGCTHVNEIVGSGVRPAVRR